MFDCVESNEVLKFKFRELQEKVVSSVNPASVIDFLLEKDVISADSMAELLSIKDDPQQCSKLLALLHTSEHPEAFIHLYLAIKRETSLQWLVEDIYSLPNTRTGYFCFM